MSLEIDLSGRRALVTGGGNGVGTEICAALVRAGAFVWVNDIYEDRAGRGRRRPRRRRARQAGEGRRHEPAQDHAYARGDRARSTSS